MRAYDPKKAAQHHDEIHAHVPSEPALRVKALESLLVEKGLVDSGAIDAWIGDHHRDQVGPKLGARVVARAWNDAAYKARLLADGTAALKELGIQGWAVGHLKVVENTDQVHNLCRLHLVLLLSHRRAGLTAILVQERSLQVARGAPSPAPFWRKFGVNLPDEVVVNVWDSTAELQVSRSAAAPEGTDGLGETTILRHLSRATA